MSATVPSTSLALLYLLLIAAATLACDANAQPHTGNASSRSTATAHSELSWASLTVSQQTALAPLKRDWSSIDHARRSKWLELAARFPSMPDDERQRVQARMTEWAQMSPEDRGRARLQFQETRNLSPEERKARWDAYMALPAEQRRALAGRRATAGTPRPGASTSAVSAVPGENHGAGDHGASKTRSTDGSAAKAVSPTLVQPRPGATTTLISSPPSPVPATPAHAAHPKVLNGASKRVNQNTLLPVPEAPEAHTAPASR